MTKIYDLAKIEVEHLIGAASRLPLVLVRAESAGAPDAVIVGRVDPAQARQIAGHLLESAARAEYEYDLITGATAAGLEMVDIVPIIELVRHGETSRHTSIE